MEKIICPVHKTQMEGLEKNENRVKPSDAYPLGNGQLKFLKDDSVKAIYIYKCGHGCIFETESFV